MSSTKQPRILPLLLGASCLLSTSGVTQVLPVMAQATPPGALSPNDPAAKLDPSLVNAPSATVPAPSTALTNASPATLNQAVGYNPATGKAEALPESAAPTTRSNRPNYGARGQIVPENAVTGRQPNSVIGADDRVKITTTTTYPWRAQAKLYTTYPNGKTYGCSGTLIQAKYLLTAGHCVYSKADGGWYKKLEVIPGLNGTYKPYGSVYGKYVRSYKGWTKSQNSNYDMALVTLDKSIGSTTGWFGYKYYSSINGVTGNIAGYPGDKGGTTLWYHYGPISSSNTYRVYYKIDTYAGQSGSAVYRIESSGSRYVFAVHTTGGSSSNSGTRLNSSKVSNISSWIATGK